MGGSGRGVEPAMLCPNSSSDDAIPQVLPPGRRFRSGDCLKFLAGKQFAFNLYFSLLENSYDLCFEISISSSPDSSYLSLLTQLELASDRSTQLRCI